MHDRDPLPFVFLEYLNLKFKLTVETVHGVFKSDPSIIDYILDQ